MIKEERRPARTCFRGGFALLFSVLLSSLLLTIGLSIFSIALKEMEISTATRQSIHAFYAADSGRECLYYWDLKTRNTPGLLYNVEAGRKIKCGETEYILAPGYNAIDNTDSLKVTSQFGSQIDPVLVSGTDGPNFYMTIEKTRLNITSSKINTVINSYGYDTVGDDRVQRALEQVY